MTRVEPGRLEARNYPMHYPARVMFGDVDAYRHGNNVAIARFFEEGRVELMARVIGISATMEPTPERMLMIASLHIDYLRQLAYPGQVEVASGVSRVGSSSFGIAHALFQGADCVAVADTVMVKTAGGRPAPLDDDERGRLEGLRLT